MMGDMRVGLSLVHCKILPDLAPSLAGVLTLVYTAPQPLTWLS